MRNTFFINKPINHIEDKDGLNGPGLPLYLTRGQIISIYELAFCENDVRYEAINRSPRY